MLKHYFRCAWASFRRSSNATSVKLLTLALGLVCFILSWGITAYWGSAEKHFENADRTLVITSEWRFIDGSLFSSGGVLPRSTHQLGAYLALDFPQLESIARVILLSESTPVRTDEFPVRLRSYAADAQFLDIFNLPFIQGDADTALTSPRSVVLSRSAAQSLYGDANAIGETLMLFDDIEATVTGVLDRLPGPSHIGNTISAPLQFDLLVSRDIYETRVRKLTGGRDTTELAPDWFTQGNTTYVLLPDDGSFTENQLRRELPDFVNRHIPEAQRELANFHLDVMPVRGLLGIGVRDSLFPQHSAVSVSLLLIVLGVIVLVVACINFANLASATAASRKKEVGIRKAVGARTGHITVQHLLETALLTALALTIAIVIFAFTVPVIRNTTGIDFVSLFSATTLGWMLVLLIVLGAIVTLSAGLYPAFVLSRVDVESSLRTGSSGGGTGGFITFLVGVQFGLAAFLLILLAIVYQQNQNLKRADNQIAGDSLLVISNSPGITGLQQERLRQELLSLPQVMSATMMETLPWTENLARMGISTSPSGTAVEQTAFVYVVGPDFFITLGIDLIAGRLFDQERASDIAASSRDFVGTQSIVISRSLAAMLPGSTISSVIDRTIYIPRSVTGDAAERPFRIIGVVEDATLSIASRHGSIPKVYLFRPDSVFHVLRLPNSELGTTLMEIDLLWQQLVPDVAIDRRFLTEYFNDSFANFERFSEAFTGLALVAWLISGIGLYTMAILIAKRRTREIAIRKTLGADRNEIVLMLLRDFSKPVLIANLFAWPFAYIAGNAYLDVFSDPLSLSFAPFALALAISLLISWVAVGGHAWKAANTPPQMVMRYE